MTDRIDKLLVQRGLAASRTQAQQLISEGLVQTKLAAGWQVVDKPSAKLPSTCLLDVSTSANQRFVSRAGLKLEAALQHANIDVAGLAALDIGQSTGGFTDCLLQRGADSVLGVDVGRDQLVAGLCNDPRVTCWEGINARDMPVDELLTAVPGGFGIAVMDVSFISQRLILPKIPAVLTSEAWLITLLKPQFELGKDAVGKGGIVRDKSLYGGLIEDIRTFVETLSFDCIDCIESPVQGGDGNTEFLTISKKRR